MKLGRTYEIRMPQMANDALSEYWLVKEFGDIHWNLLSHGLEQKTSEFKDATGNRIYAAFVRINYSLSPLNNFQENEILNLNGDINKIHNNTYHSTIDGICNKHALKANLLSKFTTRKLKDNSTISKAILNERTNHIKQAKDAPELLNEHRSLKKNLITELPSSNYNFNVTDNSITTIKYSVNPFYEINGVGLLYFACYPIITDKCTSDYFKSSDTIRCYDTNYSTIYRDIFYFANCNCDDGVLFNLNSIENLSCNKIKLTTTLYRQSDNILMARIFTIKEKIR
jgi:probable biosynthetic protein (TIGR04098 family)